MSERAITIKAIQFAVADRFGLSLEDLKSQRRDAYLSRHRMVAMVLCGRLTEHSTETIARAFGGRDHATVIHARRVIKTICERDRALADEIDGLERQLRIAGAGASGLGLEYAAELNAALNEVGLELAIVPIGTRDANGFATKGCKR